MVNSIHTNFSSLRIEEIYNVYMLIYMLFALPITGNNGLESPLTNNYFPQHLLDWSSSSNKYGNILSNDL